MASVFQLAVGAQSYDWGKIGRESKVAQFAQASPGFQLDEQKPYSELWMGTHPSLPAKLLPSGELLSSYLSAHPELLGSRVISHFGSDLPFLFKVLAVGKALSIQAHPDKELGAKLHKERPDIYKDGNHKPEMAIAITPFSGFCGFLPLPTISTFLSTTPEFLALIGSTIAHSFYSAINSPDVTEAFKKGALRSVFSALMNATASVVKEQVSVLVSRFKRGGANYEEESVKDLAIMLDEQFPGDVGVFCVFLLNVVKLGPGEAVFLKANEPHAYLSGDIIECMATSDNVVRAGLTPKLRDVPTLVSMLTYTYGSADSQLMPFKLFKSSLRTKLYDPPIEEFSVLLTELASNETEIHEAVEGPSIFIVTSGSGKIDFDGEKAGLEKEGVVFFIGTGTEVKFISGDDGLVLYRAFVEAP